MYLRRPVCRENTQDFAAEIQDSVQALASLASLHTEVLDDPASCRSVMSMVQLAYAIEHRLLRARPLLDSNASTDTCCLLYEACRFALLICISYIFRTLRASSPALQVLSNRTIKRVRWLIAQDGATLKAGQRDMLLWVLVVGGIASSDQTEYVALLSNMLWDQQAVKLPLESFVWTPSMQNDAYNTLWKSLEDSFRTRRTQI